MNETNIVRTVMLAASAMGARLFRYNSGIGWIGKSEKFTTARTVNVRPGDVLIRAARPFHGAFEGHPDTAGFSTVTIGPEHLGSRIAIACYVEVKTDTGRVSQGQRDFISLARRMGARAGVARTVEDARAILDGQTRD